MSRNPLRECLYIILVVLLVGCLSMSVTIGCVWCCICSMAWIADCESINMTMLFTHGRLWLSQSSYMVCKAERIAFTLTTTPKSKISMGKTEQLIELVREHPHLYNPRVPEHSDAQLFNS